MSRDGSAPAGLAVLRVYHSGVVGEWRRRDRALRALGVDVALVSARRWNEGGGDVWLDAGDDTFVVPARTLGRHPYRFVYDPRPLWRALRARRVDVIDVHEEPASLAAAEVMVLARLAGRRAPVCLYSAQNIEKRFPVPFRWIERATLRRAAGVHTCNRQAGRILRHKGFAGRIADLGLGVDVGALHPGSAHRRAGVATRGRTGGDLRVGYVGRLEPHKGVEVLVARGGGHPRGGPRDRGRRARLGPASSEPSSGPASVTGSPWTATRTPMRSRTPTGAWTWWWCLRWRPRPGSSSSVGWRWRPWRRAWPWWPRAAGPCPRW